MKRIIPGVFVFLLFTSIFTAGQEEEKNASDLYAYLEGREIFKSQCSPCHGARGRGDGEWAEDWTKNRPRNFRTGVFKFRSTPMGFLPTDDDLKRTIQNGISGTAMPVFRGHLTDRQLAAVVVYVKSFSKRWDDPKARAKPVELPDKPDWLSSTKQRVSHEANGAKLFATHCVACHGPSGKGDGPAALAGLKDIWGFDITPADLSQDHYKSGDSVEAHFRTIALGLDGTPMAGFRPALKDVEIWDLVAFLSNLRAKARSQGEKKKNAR